MVQFKYNKASDKYEVLIFLYKNVMTSVGHIVIEDGESIITVYKTIPNKKLQQILIHWDEYQFQLSNIDKLKRKEQ